MSVRLNALMQQLAVSEAGISGIGAGHAYAKPPTPAPKGDQLPAIINVFNGYKVAEKALQRQGHLSVWYKIGVFLMIGPYEDQAGYELAEPFIGPILATLRRDPQFRDAQGNPTCVDSKLEDEEGTAGRHWYRGRYYYGVVFNLKALVHEPVNQQ